VSEYKLIDRHIGVRAKSVRKDFDILRWSLGTCGMIKLLQVIEDEDEIGDFHGDPKVEVQDLLNKLPSLSKMLG